MGIFSEFGDWTENIWDDVTGQTAAETVGEATGQSIAAQRESLEYLKEINLLPQQYKEEALTALSQQAAGGGPTQAQRITSAQQSPYYQQLMGSQKAGEESILRHAGATGGLRSGNVQKNLYDYNVNLKNQALTSAYNQQLQEEATQRATLQGLAGISTGASEIAGITSGIGQTQAQGTMAAGQAGLQGRMDVLGGLLGAGKDLLGSYFGGMSI